MLWEADRTAGKRAHGGQQSKATWVETIQPGGPKQGATSALTKAQLRRSSEWVGESSEGAVVGKATKSGAMEEQIGRVQGTGRGSGQLRQLGRCALYHCLPRLALRAAHGPTAARQLDGRELLAAARLLSVDRHSAPPLAAIGRGQPAHMPPEKPPRLRPRSIISSSWPLHRQQQCKRYGERGWVHVTASECIPARCAPGKHGRACAENANAMLVQQLSE